MQKLLFLIFLKLLYDFDKGMQCNSEFSIAHTVFEQKSCVITVAVLASTNFAIKREREN